jgi:uncharacterized protein
MSWLLSTSTGVTLALRVVPGASKTEVCEEKAGALKIRLQAPPREGKANKALEQFLSDALGVARRDIRLLAGARARTKRVAIAGIAPEDARARLLARAAGARNRRADSRNAGTDWKAPEPRDP